MSGQVHITKARDWLEARQQRIGLREWIEIVETDDELHLKEPKVNPARDEGVLREAPGMALWRKAAGREVAFEYHHGQVSVVAGDDDAINKAKMVAARLEARVLTDNGEEC
jgi:hypothetical protein